MTSLHLLSADSGIAEYGFTVQAGAELVPGLLWRPSSEAGRTAPCVLIGHGRSSHKRNPHVLERAHRLVAGHGWTVVAIDAPGHGERRPAGAGPQDIPPRPAVAQAVQEWRACVGELADAGELDRRALGYWGLSMGTGLGTSLVAEEPGIQAAVLGLMHANWPAPPGERIRSDAARISCPVLFLLNWDDQRAPRASGFELFDLIGAADKRLHAYPGDHGELPEEALTATHDFLARYLDG